MKGKEEVHKSCLSWDFIRTIILGRKCMLMHDWSNPACELKCRVLTEKNALSHFCWQIQKLGKSGSLSEMQRSNAELSVTLVSPSLLHGHLWQRCFGTKRDKMFLLHCGGHLQQAQREDSFGCTETRNRSIFKFIYHIFILADES